MFRTLMSEKDGEANIETLRERFHKKLSNKLTFDEPGYKSVIFLLNKL